MTLFEFWLLYYYIGITILSGFFHFAVCPLDEIPWWLKIIMVLSLGWLTMPIVSVWLVINGLNGKRNTKIISGE